jgi:hypothetical protein
MTIFELDITGPKISRRDGSKDSDVRCDVTVVGLAETRSHSHQIWFHSECDPTLTPFGFPDDPEVNTMYDDESLPSVTFVGIGPKLNVAIRKVGAPTSSIATVVPRTSPIPASSTIVTNLLRGSDVPIGMYVIPADNNATADTTDSIERSMHTPTT